MTRRRWIGRTITALAGACLPAMAASEGNGIRKAVLITMLPRELSYLDRFKIAVDAGFQLMEVQTVEDEAEARQIKGAADQAGLRIHCVMNMAHGRYPFSSDDPKVIEAGLRGMEVSLRQAHLYGADAVLLVPGSVREDVTYEQCWERSQPHVRKLIPLAEKLDVTIAIENVSNRFLLRAKHFAQYVDEFNHPKVCAYFDVGNCLSIGVPQHWIRQLGKRIVKIHLKGRYEPMSMNRERPIFGEDHVPWNEVRKALEEVGFRGVATLEVQGGDQEYLAELGRRVDRLVCGKG